MKGYLKLLNDNRGRGLFECQRNKDAKGAEQVSIYLYDTIVADKLTAEMMGGVDPETFVKALNDIDEKTIHLRINSPGGDVFAARSIEQALRDHPARVIAHIDGYAASAASFVAMAADEISMNKGGFLMIHKAWTMTLGNRDDLKRTAELLTQIDGSLAQTYSDRSGQSLAEIDQWMADETWMNAELALRRGFIDRIDGDEQAESLWDLAAYKRPPSDRGRSNSENQGTDSDKAKTLLRARLLSLDA